MNDSFAIQSNPVSTAATRLEPAVRSLQQPDLLRALGEISDDSQRHPETYLRDTVVPHGGE